MDPARLPGRTRLTHETSGASWELGGVRRGRDADYWRRRVVRCRAETARHRLPAIAVAPSHRRVGGPGGHGIFDSTDEGARDYPSCGHEARWTHTALWTDSLAALAARIAVVGARKIAWSADAGNTWEIRPPPEMVGPDGNLSQSVPIGSLAGGRSSEELVALYPNPLTAPQVLVHRPRGWSHTAPALVSERDEDSPFLHLVDASYDAASDSHLFITWAGTHLVRLDLSGR